MEGPPKSVNILLALDALVEKALCYYDGEDAGQLAGVRDSIIICKPGLVTPSEMNNTFIYTDHPQLAFYYVSQLFVEKPETGIHPSTAIDKKARIGSGVSIGAFCVVDECIIGDNVILDSGVRIYGGTVIGSGVHVQSGTVIGASGVMWAWDEHGNKVSCSQTGNVIIEDAVFIGSNITLVRGAFPNKPTIVGRGTMMAHGTMIGHGVVIGAGNHFANNVSLAGSVSTGTNCFFGSGAVVRPHVHIADDTIVGAGAVVIKDVAEEGQVLVGNPARPLSGKNRHPAGVPSPY